MYGVGLLNAYSVRQVYFGLKRSHQTVWLERVSVELDQFSMFSNLLSESVQMPHDVSVPKRQSLIRAFIILRY
jgi:hypothetical protein